MVAVAAPPPRWRPEDRAERASLRSVVRADRALALVPLALAIGRFLAVAGMRGYRYVDSAEYGTVDLTGRSRRPWATPLLYALVDHDPVREVRVQALVGVVAWTFLAWAAAAWFPKGPARLVVAGSLAALGLTTSVTNWDAAILSESLAISLTVALLAAWLELARRRTPGAAVAVGLVTVPWLFVRQSLLPTAALVALAAAIAAVATWTRHGRWRVVAGLAVGLVLLTGLAAASYDRNQEVVRTNLAVIIVGRLGQDPEHLAWLRDHGMPEPPALDHPTTFDPATVGDDPPFARWLERDGRSTYARFLLAHPWWTLTAPLPDLTGERPSYGDPPETRLALLSPADAYGRVRPVLPEPVEQVLFDPGATGTVLGALAVVVVWSGVRRRRAGRRWAVPVATIAISVASLVIGWHGALPELNRLAIVAAVALRVGLIVQLGLLAVDERALRRPADADAAPLHDHPTGPTAAAPGRPSLAP